MPVNGAFVTLLTKLAYLPGALVLHQTLRAVGSKYPLVVMVTPKVPSIGRYLMQRCGIVVRDVEPLRPTDGVHVLADLDARFEDTWTKLRGFELVEYDRVVLLDSDMIVMKNMDELMEVDLPNDWIAAAHACTCNPYRFAHYPADWVPQNCAHSSVVHPSGLTSPPAITDKSPRTYLLLNSGTVVLSPSLERARSLERFLETSPLVPTFSFPDQDLLAWFFKGKWKVLPYCYNALKTLRIFHPALWRDEEVRCLHYILPKKPWHIPPGRAGEFEEMHQLWWDRYYDLAKQLKGSDPEGWRLVDSHVVH